MLKTKNVNYSEKDSCTYQELKIQYLIVKIEQFLTNNDLYRTKLHETIKLSVPSE